MKNFVCEGCRVVGVATAGGVTSGQLLLIGSKAVVAVTAAAEAENFSAKTEGVFEVPKAAGVVTQGAKLYFDATAKNLTTTATSNTLVGWAYAAAASGDATVQVALNCGV